MNELIECKLCKKIFSKYGIKNHIYYAHLNKKNKGGAKKGVVPWNKGIKTKKKPTNYVEIRDIFEGKFPKFSTTHLREKLIKEGYKKTSCEKCKIEPSENTFRGIELHHIDGNAYNNKLDNLVLLCPNCHSLTKNYKNCNNHKSVRKNRK